jgi:hypothetical protein
MAKAKKAKSAAKSHHKKPTSARLLKNRPVDKEPPETEEQETPESAGEPENEAEQLETPSTPKPKRTPRQARLPGVDDPEIEELESAAEEYVDVRDRRMALTEEEVELKGELLKLMHEHNKTKYVHNGTEIRVVAKDETVKVKIKKKEE